MFVSGVQFLPEFGEKSKNIKKIISYVNDIDSDIIIFPELSTTGYFFQNKDEVKYVAEKFNGQTVTLIQKLATEQNKIIIFGFAEEFDDKYYNSAAILFPDKQLSKVYRKTHLFYKESFCFSEGNTGFFVIEDKSKDVKIGTMICYDWRFPEASRSLALLGADIIICPSNLVTNIWRKVMPARAIENKVYFAVINRIGTENRNNEELFFNGDSAIYDYNGEILDSAQIENEKVIKAEIFPEKTRNKSFNELNDIFTDRRPDYYVI